MPIAGVVQPEMRLIAENLRLKKLEGEDVAFAREWYLDPDILFPMDGAVNPYSLENIKGMYQYLRKHGELYIIEYLENGEWNPIGDVTFWREDMPIVIGRKDLHGRGIGKRVVHSLIERAREIGYSEIYVQEIYDFNLASQKMFEGCGFHRMEKTEKGWRYVCRLNDIKDKSNA